MRLIDADKIADFVCSVCGGDCDVQHRSGCIERNYTEQCAKEMPTVDAVPVVRCKDCQYADSFSECRFVSWYNNKDDFCSRGERREDADT